MRRLVVIVFSLALSGLAMSLAVVAFRSGSPSATTRAVPSGSIVSAEGSVNYPGGRQIPSSVWTDPFSPDAGEVASVEAAKLPFQPDTPDGLGQPAKIVASDEGRNSVVAWVYDDPDWGPYIFDEQIQYFTQEDFEKSVGAPVEIIRGGIRAVVVQTDQIIAVEWLEPLKDVAPGLLDDAPANAALEVELVAPANGKMSVSHLLELANKA